VPKTSSTGRPAQAIAIQLPIGAEQQFKGHRRPRPHEGRGCGTRRRWRQSITTSTIPADMAELAREHREKLIEAAVRSR